MEWFWGVTGGVVVVLLGFAALYDRRACKRGSGQLEPREPSKDHTSFNGYGGGGCASCSS
jgi:hypothetical protein